MGARDLPEGRTLKKKKIIITLHCHKVLLSVRARDLPEGRTLKKKKIMRCVEVRKVFIKQLLERESVTETTTGAEKDITVEVFIKQLLERERATLKQQPYNKSKAACGEGRGRSQQSK